MLIRAPQAMRETLAGAGAGAGDGAGQSGHGGLQRLHERLKAAFDPRGILNPGLELLALP
jgi:FAD/FMN-containing dehydrogenase